MNLLLPLFCRRGSVGYGHSSTTLPGKLLNSSEAWVSVSVRVMLTLLTCPVSPTNCHLCPEERRYVCTGVCLSYFTCEFHRAGVMGAERGQKCRGVLS